jgi:glutamate--cysteine ligase
MSSPPLTRERLLERFHGYGQPRERWRVGGEFERQALRPDGGPVGFFEEHGIQQLLLGLAERNGWRAIREGTNVIGLCGKDDPDGPGPCLTLEPGGQVELSGSPHRSLLALRDELMGFQRDLLAVARGRPVRWVACGYTPVAPLEAIGWVPKSRYEVMREYLPRRGPLAHHMMKATCAVQVNYDYADEGDCARKVQAAARVAPLITAVFANSPLRQGRDTGFQSYRAHIWSQTDPDRCGLPQWLVEGYSHDRWLDYLLQVPMMFVRIDGEHLPANGRSFGDYMSRGHQGHFPTMDDWELHQTSVFPELRVKRTLEVRGIDCVPPRLAVGVCALYTGLLYDDDALDACIELGGDLSRHGSASDLLARAARSGMQARAGRSFASWAQELVTLARAGLAKREPAALPLLEPVEALVEGSRSPAVALLDAWRRDPRPEALVDFVSLDESSLDQPLPGNLSG